MKKAALILAVASLPLAAPLVSFAMDHGSKPMEHQHGGDMMTTGNVAHEEVIDGVKATFEVLDIREQMKGTMPKGMKDTHHVMVKFTDAKSGKKITEGEVKVKIVGPDKSEQVKDLMGMQGHFGVDFIMAKKGKYGIMAKFKLKDGTVRQAKFWYTVK
jgi:hypothetical protein